MQKFRVMSDLHQEFGAFEVPELPDDKNTILILAGDIHTGTNATKFIDPLLARFQEVIYVLGNHEFYHNDMDKVRKWWNMAQRYRSNFHVLDNGVFEVEGLRILGTTLWTYTNDPVVELMLNDYACIYHNGEVLTAQGTRDLYLKNLAFLMRELKRPFRGATIVVTHHAPVEKCVDAKFVGSELNKCFHNHLDWLIEENDIDLWVHGHMHDTVHFMYHGTEIYCNPRGYAGYGGNVDFNMDMVIEI